MQRHTQGEKWNNAICSSIDESRGNHATFSKSESERHISCGITYRCYLKIDTSEDISTEKGNHSFIKQTYGSPNGKVWGLDTLWYWGEQRYTNTCEIYNHQRPMEFQEKTTQHCVITHRGNGSEDK